MTTATATRAPRGVYDEERGQTIAERIEQARERGFTNAELQELAGFNGSQLWRARNGRIHPNEVDILEGVLDRIERDELTPARQESRAGRGGGYVTRAILANRLSRVASLLDEAHKAKTAKETNALVEQARAAVVGVDGDDDIESDSE